MGLKRVNCSNQINRQYRSRYRDQATPTSSPTYYTRLVSAVRTRVPVRTLTGIAALGYQYGMQLLYCNIAPPLQCSIPVLYTGARVRPVHVYRSSTMVECTTRACTHTCTRTGSYRYSEYTWTNVCAHVCTRTVHARVPVVAC